jgi:hypothetical protein
MVILQSAPRRRRFSRSRRPYRLDWEALEPRTLPAALFLAPLAEIEPNNTLDQAQNLGAVSSAGHLALTGTVGGADVDWFQFTLDAAARVTVTTTSDNPAAPPLVSLFNNDPFDFNDPFDPLGHRLLEQGSDVTRALAAGTYYVAISGSGNHAFNPFLADSGYPGAAATYRVDVNVGDVGFGSSDSPTVLALAPAAGAVLTHSPQILRVDFNTGLDPTFIDPTSNVTLTYNPVGDFGGPDDQIVSVAFASFSDAIQELQILPAAALSPGYYRLTLAGDSSVNPFALIGTDGVYLGTDAEHPNGQDFNATFVVAGSEGAVGADGTQGDDTAATAHELGSVLDTRVAVTGTIGDDPSNPVFLDTNDVDLYHFHLDGAGRYAFQAEVFAGRIGSPLVPGVSLFRLDPTDGLLHIVDGNDGTANNIAASDGPVPQPLKSDAALFAGLTAGDYYIAVSSHGNVPVPEFTVDLPGQNGIFDPNISHSGWAGVSFGDYQLNVLVELDNVAPRVVSSTLSAGLVLDKPPEVFTVSFSEAVNLQQLAYNVALTDPSAPLASVAIVAADGAVYSPRFRTFDAATNEATFVMDTALPNGAFALHFSGPLGLADGAGNPLVGNTPGGDYVIPFTVQGPTRGTDGDATFWISAPGNDDGPNSQRLGTLFPAELKTGVTIARDSATAAQQPGDSADYYDIHLLQSGFYVFALDTASPGVHVILYDALGNNVALDGDGLNKVGLLNDGTYLVGVAGWSSADAAGVVYQLHMFSRTSGELPTTLTVGPAPALRIKLATLPPAPTRPQGEPTPAPPGVTSRSPVTTTTTTTNSPSNSNTIALATAGLFAELAAGPIGAVRGPDAARSDRVLVQGPNASLLDTLVQLTVLTSPDALETTPDSGASSIQSLVQDAGQTWDDAVEALFRLTDWLRAALPTSRDVVTDEEVVVPDITEPPLSEAPPLFDATEPPDVMETVVDPSEGDPSCAALLGLAAVFTVRPKGTERTKRSVRLERA